jgi:hypothetical protein
MTKTIKVPQEHQHLANLRVADLVAKTAKVTFKDTVRVLIAARAVCKMFGIPLSQLADAQHDGTKPTSDNVTACEQAYAELETADPEAVKRVASYR